MSRMRRMGARWRDESTPAEVLDILKIEGRYEVLTRNGTVDGAEEWADGLDLDADGHGYATFELEPYQAAQYRYRNGKRRTRWADLPDAVRATVVSYLESAR